MHVSAKQMMSVLSLSHIQMYQNMDDHVSKHPSGYQNRQPYSRETGAGLPSPQDHTEDS